MEEIVVGLICHTSKGEEELGLFWPVFSYASDVDLLRKRKDSLAPEKGDTGGVEPAGEAGADPLGLWLPPGGFTIMILRVTLTASSGKSSPYDFTLPLSDSLPEADRKAKVWCFRSLPRPFSGRGPATVSSHK
uniref:Uncharacterized protein n=1 Tax=Glycine max TaxID=3847 RepID=C6SZ39_SOYBN|nr:unknown [Glycine max]